MRVTYERAGALTVNTLVLSHVQWDMVKSFILENAIFISVSTYFGLNLVHNSGINIIVTDLAIGG